ncbi:MULTISPECIES: DoxX family membrane protein [unclassified Spirosoma]|uniref:DoxX family membrane protein n=1 Tax=unclassified Spirosoma TaxID=2621999 RepID=UPI000959D005|nr:MULTISPECIES: DoxX family membrane protein [unclassified Spirosoma]MBN8823893.1 DoxX family membrane protein [Spirosoma sp.]OJW79715.1 MAG: hypothetical protein BGO59_00230 [Spirosoma sp. 48-14]
MKFLPKDQYWPYLLLAARVLLAYTLFNYGWAKLTGNQFGVDQKTMNLPLKEIGLFRLSWYLADHQPFKAFIGVSQISVALLLIFNRTLIIGAFASIPIWLNILMWDMTFMEGMTTAFTFRLSFYLLLTGLILYQSRDKVLPALQSVSEKRSTITYPYWVYLTLPVAAICLEVLGAIPNAILFYTGLWGK